MSPAEPTRSPLRVRRQPPPFRRVAVRRREHLTPRMLRVTLGGSELAAFTVDEPAASVRLLLPSPGGRGLVIPQWNGNEFLMPDGSRPALRTLTPWQVHPETNELDVGIVIHGDGFASEWATTAESGDEVAVSGPGRGYRLDASAPAFLLIGDETAIPAITQILDVVPLDTPVSVAVEVAHLDGRLDLSGPPAATVSWFELPVGAPSGETLMTAVAEADIEPGTRVWAAGEAAAMQRIRRHLFEDRGVPRPQTTIRGYWKHGRRAGGDDEE